MGVIFSCSSVFIVSAIHDDTSQCRISDRYFGFGHYLYINTSTCTSYYYCIV